MPYPNEHSCRLQDPDQYDSFARGECDQKHNGKCIDVIYGIKNNPKRHSEVQALRYPTKNWTESEARDHCKTRKGSFEPASKGKEGEMVIENQIMLAFKHNSTVDDNEPDWADVDKTKLPRIAFADQGDEGKKSTWGYPHHWVKGGSKTDDNGCYTNGTLYLHRGGLAAAWQAANGARGGGKAPQGVLTHLNAHRKDIGMGDENKGGIVMNLTKEDLKEAYPEVIAQIEEIVRNEGKAESFAAGLEEGATKERERIKSVEAQLIPGHEELIASLKYDGKTTGPEAAVKILEAEKKIRGDELTRIQADRVPPLPQPAPPVAEGDGIDPNLPVEERAKKRWEKSPEIRAEFFNKFESYLAFVKHEEAGDVRILKQEKGGK
jgi:hypothetical protein